MNSRLAWSAVAMVVTATAAFVVAKKHAASPVLPGPDVAVMAPAHPSGARFRDKVWLHRVNSVERARAMASTYPGFEIDVHFDSARGCFDVTHDIEHSIGLCLDDLLQALDDNAERYFWLDFKNLHQSNQRTALASLSRLFGVAARAHVVVESESPQLLAPFTDAGYFTSYYLPYFELDELTPGRVRSLVEEIAWNLRTSRVNAISGYHFQYPFMQRHFPHLDLLLWDLRPVEDPIIISQRAAMLADDRVRVLLLTVPSAGER